MNTVEYDMLDAGGQITEIGSSIDDFSPNIYRLDFLAASKQEISAPAECDWFDNVATNPPWGAVPEIKNPEMDEILSREVFSLYSVYPFNRFEPACCDVFAWIAVWRDVIRYWVLSSDEVATNKYFSQGQHRGNIGEGQLWIKDSNTREFAQYEVGVRDILTAIENKVHKYKKVITE